MINLVSRTIETKHLFNVEKSLLDIQFILTINAFLKSEFLFKLFREQIH
jgi:hypothetical protein